MRQYCTYNRQSISVGSLYNKEQYNGSQIFLLAMILQLVLSRIIPPLLDILTMESLATYVEHPLKNSKHDNMDGILYSGWWSQRLAFLPLSCVLLLNLQHFYLVPVALGLQLADCRSSLRTLRSRR